MSDNVSPEQLAALFQTVTRLTAQVESLTNHNQHLEQQLSALSQLPRVVQPTTDASTGQHVLKVPPPDKFDGSLQSSNRLQEWVLEVENWLKCHRTTERLWVPGARSVLTGAAMTWFHSWARTTTDANDWQSFKAALLQRFLPEGQETLARTKLMTLKQKAAHKVRNYTHEFIELSEQLPNVDAGTKMFHYLKGLQPEIGKLVSLQRPDTLEKAIDLAITLDDLEHSAVVAAGNVAGSVPMVLGAVTAGAQPATGKTRKGMNWGLPKEEYDKRRKAGLCYRCGEQGHMAKACPTKKTPNAKA